MNSKSILERDSLTEDRSDSLDIALIPRPRCSLCRSQGKQLYPGLQDWLFGARGIWSLRQCLPCGVTWLDPQPSAEDIPKLYARYYTHRSTPRTRFDPLREATRQCVLARMGYRVEPAKGLLPRTLSHMHSSARAASLDVMNLSASDVGDLLDVGCGNGAFMMRMRSLGWRVSGVDPDPAAVAQGQSQGLEVFCGTVQNVPENRRYDAITLSHVIEHALDPVVVLRECGRRLRPNTGRVIVTTPNINSLGHWWFGKWWRGLEIPRHLELFSPEGFSRCARQAGLTVISLSTEARMARMIYAPSTCGKRGEQNVGERTDFEVSTKIACYLFQLFENILIRLKPDAGEEIFCVCSAPASV